MLNKTVALLITATSVISTMADASADIEIAGYKVQKLQHGASLSFAAE